MRNGGVTIGANNSFLQTLPATNIPGIFVRNDGNVIRIELPARLLFETGNTRLLPGAANLIGDVAAEIVRTYPDQIIGVEGHTDNDPVGGNQWQGNQELSIARAGMVYDVFVNRTRLDRRQLFTVGKGFTVLDSGFRARPMWARTMSSRLTSSTVQAGSMIGSWVRISRVLWRSVWVSSITCWLDGSRDLSRRGPLSRRWLVSSSSTSPVELDVAFGEEDEVVADALEVGNQM